MDRFTTDHRSTPVMTQAMLDAGHRYADNMAYLGLPSNICETAFATCTIQIMGKYAHADNGTAHRSNDFIPGMWWSQGRWVLTKLQTYGNLPSRRFSRSGTTERARYAIGNSFEAANDVLSAFNLDMDDVLEHFGDVEPAERKIISLFEIVSALYDPIVHQIGV